MFWSKKQKEKESQLTRKHSLKKLQGGFQMFRRTERRKVKRSCVRRTVKAVPDGDTIRVARKIGHTNIIRLANFNAPEKYQYGGKKATATLNKMIGGKTVTVCPKAVDSYGRIVADIYHKRQNINKKLREIG